MERPWERQARQSAWLVDPGALPCPVCDTPTPSLKQYQFVRWLVFYFAGAWWQTEYYRACPHCTRQWVARRAARNLLPANLLWFVLVLPWAVGLFVASYRRGHSAAVLRNVSPLEAARVELTRAAAANEVNWGRVWLLVGVPFGWVPVVGLPLALAAYFTNRRATDWKRPVARVVLAVSAAVHLIVAALVVGAQLR